MADIASGVDAAAPLPKPRGPCQNALVGPAPELRATDMAGGIIYTVATIIAGAILVVVVAGFVYSAGKGEPFIQVGALVLAVVIWLFGWACRYLFGRQ